MRVALALLLPLIWVGGATLAQVDAPAAEPAPLLRDQPPPKKALPVARRSPSTSAAAMTESRRAHRSRAPAKPPPPPSRAEALAGCLDLWEPATHMTRRQWRRACRRVAAR